MLSTITKVLKTINKPLGQLNNINATIGKNSAGILLAMMVLMIIAQVGFRYILNDSLTWTEELSKFAMVWIACLVAPWAYLHHLNVSIDMFHEALPKGMQRIAEIIITLLVLIITFQFFKYSVGFVSNGMSINAASVPISLFYIYLCMPYVFASLFLVGIEKLIHYCTVPLNNDMNSTEGVV
ncbi:TRAP transporter small permease [Glaciecola petra]|uniref:TRAP transporter small permease protein n=1 Tax=Glaciecola petra TaxID=3075602 RepID=A0ABU2ZRB1_9ALTE|nr:TRAP transporter small permease [Aestuariibacter sp. P117]MDT0595170.1 TRAP transporter small permease [Aestuariibacter sp. P117]